MTRLPRIEVAERRARLALRHRLLPQTRTDDLPTIADDLVALHSTDPVTVFLSAMARMQNPSIRAVEKTLYGDRRLVRHHAMRRTLWVATPEVVRLMHAAATRRLVGPEHRRTTRLLAENGVADPDAWLADARERILAALHEHGPMNTRELGRRVPALGQKLQLAPGKKYAATVSAHTRVLLQLGFEGKIVRTRPASWISGAYTWAAMDDWLEGGIGDLDEREAATALAGRWLARFGPATITDLRWWTGWTAALTKHALAACGAEPVDLAGPPGQGGEPGWVAPGDQHPVGPADPWVALLPSLDPTTMGWKQRDWYLDPACVDVFDSMGNAGPTIWVDGRVVGGWAQAPDGEIRLHYLLDVPARRRRAVLEEAERIRAAVGEATFSVRFPGLVNTVLLGDGGRRARR